MTGSFITLILIGQQNSSGGVVAYSYGIKYYKNDTNYLTKTQVALTHASMCFVLLTSIITLFLSRKPCGQLYDNHIQAYCQV